MTKLLFKAIIYRGGYLQTILGELLFNTFKHIFIGDDFNIKKTVIVKSHDDQDIQLHYLHEEPAHKTRVIIVISHGMSDFMPSCYINPWFNISKKHNFTTIVIHRKTYHAIYNEEQDYILVNDYIYKKHACGRRDISIIGVGFSAGGLHTTRYACHPNCKWTAAASISTCNDLLSMLKYIRCNRLIDEFLYLCVASIHGKHDYEIKVSDGCLSTFDAEYATKILKYPSVEDYYTAMSTHLDLLSVRIPFLVVLSKDDPLLPPGTIENVLQSAKKNNHILPIITEHGGHVGWVVWRWFKKPYSMMHRYIINFVYACLPT